MWRRCYTLDSVLHRSSTIARLLNRGSRSVPNLDMDRPRDQTRICKIGRRDERIAWDILISDPSELKTNYSGAKVTCREACLDLFSPRPDGQDI